MFVNYRPLEPFVTPPNGANDYPGPLLATIMEAPIIDDPVYHNDKSLILDNKVLCGVRRVHLTQIGAAAYFPVCKGTI